MLIHVLIVFGNSVVGEPTSWLGGSVEEVTERFSPEKMESFIYGYCLRVTRAVVWFSARKVTN